MTRHAALSNGGGVRFRTIWRRMAFGSAVRPTRGIAEEAPRAYEDVDAVVAAAASGVSPPRRAAVAGDLHSGLR